ncbi:MAG TPA: DNA-directed RNA polymerase subunit alpha C-terminal domain-containing protein [Planctomycetota bacterium]|nr:DNA-directed RNA polymerase subunit alpha C-terminal domain-containing protein [Planctomycetota bacterium]
MVEEPRVAAPVIDSICAHPLDAEAILKIRYAARNSTVERTALQTWASDLDQSALSKEEKALRHAAFNWILGTYDKSESAKGMSGAAGHVIRGGSAFDKGKFDEAISELKSALGISKSVKIAVELAAALRASGKIEDAQKVLAGVEQAGASDSDWWVQKGWCTEALGLQEAACTAYEKALSIDPRNALAAFRLAYYLDLRGEDVRAIELYKRVTGPGSAFVNAMINVGMLYEDKDDVEAAIACYKEAIKADPANRRAALYLRDAVESLDMYYDETQRKESDRLEAVLRIPVNDFELSVRSRNCLAKMNVKTLGDMVRKTEPELLAYKNFGETSLREIKQLLESKGLRLGMHKEEEQKRARAQRLRLGATENTALAKPITDLELSVRSRKCMQRLNIETIGDLCEKSEADLLATKNFGQTSLTEVKQKLGELNLGLKQSD